MEEGLLQPQEVVQSRFPISGLIPFKNVDELVLFQHFIERGLALPTSDFLRGLLSFFLWDLDPSSEFQSILHLSNFVHFCEAFLEIQPYWNLFHYLFHLKPQPKSNNPHQIGGCGFQLNLGWGSMYIDYSTLNSLYGWKNYWFYIRNHAPPLPR